MSREIFGKIKHIGYSPIKGAEIITLQEGETIQISRKGLQGDREYAIVRADAEKGVHRWVSARDKRESDKQPQTLGIISLIRQKLTSDYLEMSWQGSDPIRIPRDRHDGDHLYIQIWGDTIEAVDQEDEAAEWLSDYLNYPVRLVRELSVHQRGVSQKWLPNMNKLRLQDSYPMNWFTQESLDKLNEKLAENSIPAIPWTQMRPNIVVEGAQAHAEHEFDRGFFAGFAVANAKPCDRCPVPLTKPDTGEKMEDGQPLRTLTQYSQWRKPTDGKVVVIFGEGALPLEEGELHIGDEVNITTRRSPKIIFGGAEIRKKP